MHHLVVETCLFQRKVVVREFNEENPCTYAVYVDTVTYMLKTNSGPTLG